MSAILESYLDTLRRSDCMRNDWAMKVEAPVRPAGFECVEVRVVQTVEQGMECCDE